MFKDMSGIGAFVVHQVSGEVFAGGEGFGNVVRLGLACRVGLGGFGCVRGVVLLDFSGARWFLDLSIRGLLQGFR